MTSPPQLLDHALPRIEAFIAARGISDATFGTYAVNDPAFVGRLREGRATIRIAQRAIDWIARQEAAAAVGAGTGRSSEGPPIVAAPLNAAGAAHERQIGEG